MQLLYSLCDLPNSSTVLCILREAESWHVESLSTRVCVQWMWYKWIDYDPIKPIPLKQLAPWILTNFHTWTFWYKIWSLHIFSTLYVWAFSELPKETGFDFGFQAKWRCSVACSFLRPGHLSWIDKLWESIVMGKVWLNQVPIGHSCGSLKTLLVRQVGQLATTCKVLDFIQRLTCVKVPVPVYV